VRSESLGGWKSGGTVCEYRLARGPALDQLDDLRLELPPAPVLVLDIVDISGPGRGWREPRGAPDVTIEVTEQTLEIWTPWRDGAVVREGSGGWLMVSSTDEKTDTDDGITGSLVQHWTAHRVGSPE
jgi:hypothetical protein